MKNKIYLDANIIYGYFLAKAKELRNNAEYSEPKVIEALRENKDAFYLNEEGNKNSHGEIKTNRESDGTERSKSKGLSTFQGHLSGGVQQKDKADIRGNSQEDGRKARSDRLKDNYGKPYLPILFLLLFTGIAFATHNPSVSHSATNIVNGMFSDNYKLEARI